MLTPLCIELPKFKVQHLIDIGNFCLECIQKGHTGAMWYVDMHYYFNHKTETRD